MKVKCENCQDDLWVCENHENQPWLSGDGCCGGAGMPCPKCNVSNRDNPPRMPDDFEEIEI